MSDPAHQIKGDGGAGRVIYSAVDLPGNSKTKKDENPSEERAPVEKVITDGVVQRKRSIFSRAASMFIASDTDSVLQYIVTEVLVPAAKNMIQDAVSQGFEQMLFGGARAGRANRPGHTNYTRYSDPVRTQAANQAQAARVTPIGRTAHAFSDIILKTRGDAEDVLDGLRNLIAQYETASVSDLYELVGITADFTDNKWGWSDLRSASVRAVRGGYILNLPRTHAL